VPQKAPIRQALQARKPQLCQLHSRPKFDFVEEPGDNRVRPFFTPVADHAGKFCQTVLGDAAHEKVAPNLLQPVQKVESALSAPTPFRWVLILVVNGLRRQKATDPRHAGAAFDRSRGRIIPAADTVQLGGELPGGTTGAACRAPTGDSLGG